MRDKKISKLTLIIVVLIGIAVLIGIGYYTYSQVKVAGQTGDWQIFRDAESGLSFKYPAELKTKYINPVDWPPQLRVLNEPFKCTEGGTSTRLPAGQTNQEKINGRTYCVTRESEGAAGSIYNMYAYAFPYNNQTAILTFSLRFPQCPNYPEPQQSECRKERDAFDIGPTAAKIAESLSK